MTKRVVIPYVLTIFIVGLIAILGILNTYQQYQHYGWTYTVTTIIHDVETTQTIHLMNNVITCGVLIWIILLLIYAVKTIPRHEPIF